MKDVMGGVCPVRAFCGQGGRAFFRCGRPQLFWCKNFGFFEIYGVSVRTNGGRGVDLSHCGHEGRGQFCAYVFYELPLIQKFSTQACFKISPKARQTTMTKTSFKPYVYLLLMDIRSRGGHLPPPLWKIKVNHTKSNDLV